MCIDPVKAWGKQRRPRFSIGTNFNEASRFVFKEVFQYLVLVLGNFGYPNIFQKRFNFDFLVRGVTEERAEWNWIAFVSLEVWNKVYSHSEGVAILSPNVLVVFIDF